MAGVAATSAPPCATSPRGARLESMWWMTEALNSFTNCTLSWKSRIPAGSLKTWISMPRPIAPKTYRAPVSPRCPVLTISAQARLSGKGRPASTASVRRRRMMNRMPRRPPISRMSEVSQ